jgi:release factor glutamine methyltransferase
LTVQDALKAGRIDPREARLLLAAAGGFSEAAILAFPERTLPDDVERQYLDYVGRRAAGEPVAYILGRKEFYGMELAVSPAVLVPRPETELLVDLALERRPASVLDLGTGSGAIAIALKRHLPASRVVASDASAEALEVARTNCARFNVEVELRQGAWFDAVRGERFEAIVCNPPYVRVGDPHLVHLPFEPRLALTSGDDGLDAIRLIAREAPAHLLPGGWLLMEHGEGQHASVQALLREAGLETEQGWPDLAGIPRVAGGRR